MMYLILTLPVIALFIAWIYEYLDSQHITCAAKRYRSERDEEFRLRRKAESEAEVLTLKLDSYERVNTNLARKTVEYALSDWERREVEDIPGLVEYERDGIVLIYEGGKVVGWRKADTVQVRFKRPKRKTKTPEQSTYEAPSAEAVIANVGGNEEGS